MFSRVDNSGSGKGIECVSHDADRIGLIGFDSLSMKTCHGHHGKVPIFVHATEGRIEWCYMDVVKAANNLIGSCFSTDINNKEVIKK